MQTLTIRQAWEEACKVARAQGVKESQVEMVAALAVKDSMEDTLDNLKALSAITKEICARRFETIAR